MGGWVGRWVGGLIDGVGGWVGGWLDYLRTGAEDCTQHVAHCVCQGVGHHEEACGSGWVGGWEDVSW